MLFNSTEYFIFFGIVFILYYIIPFKFRPGLLLISGLYFYFITLPEYIFVPIIIIAVTYTCGRIIENSQQYKKKVFLAGITINLALLVFFKYIRFITIGLLNTLNIQGINKDAALLNLIVPLGISYITFQAIGYLIEIKEGRHKAENNLIIFAAYIMFFPKLVAGPVERAHNLIPQFYEKKEFNDQQTGDGIKLIFWGLFKKVVIADRIAIAVNQIYGNVHDYNGFYFIIATFLYSIQIYCDFSGYTDVALGTAQTLGFKLTDNFRRPYLSKSISEYWTRWHITLSSWLHDYLYTPLALKTRMWGKAGIIFSLTVTFLLCGLWHGDNWTFIAWGGLHGLALSTEFITKKIRKKFSHQIGSPIYNKIAALTTFSFISFSFIFFRANSIKDAGYIITHLFSGFGEVFANISNTEYIRTVFRAFGLTEQDVIIITASIVFLFITEMIQEKMSIMDWLKSKSTGVRWAIYYALLLLFLFYGTFNYTQNFIYFQF